MWGWYGIMYAELLIQWVFRKEVLILLSFSLSVITGL